MKVRTSLEAVVGCCISTAVPLHDELSRMVQALVTTSCLGDRECNSPFRWEPLSDEFIVSPSAVLSLLAGASVALIVLDDTLGERPGNNWPKVQGCILQAWEAIKLVYAGIDAYAWLPEKSQILVCPHEDQFGPFWISSVDPTPELVEMLSREIKKYEVLTF